MVGDAVVRPTKHRVVLPKSLEFRLVSLILAGRYCSIESRLTLGRIWGLSKTAVGFDRCLESRGDFVVSNALLLGRQL